MAFNITLRNPGSVFDIGFGSGTAHDLDGVLNTLSGMTGAAGCLAAMAGIVQPLSGATGDAKADRGMAGAAAVLAGAEGAIAINNALTAALNTLSGMTGAAGLINGIGTQSDALSDMAGVIMTFTSFEGAIAAVSRMFELFRYLNPVSVDSVITQGASYGSDIFTAGAYASAMATAVDGYSAAATGETYLSIISTEVMA